MLSLFFLFFLSFFINVFIPPKKKSHLSFILYCYFKKFNVKKKSTPHITRKENNGASSYYRSSNSMQEENQRIYNALLHFSTHSTPLHLPAGRINWSYWLCRQRWLVVYYALMQICHSHVSSLYAFCWICMHKLILLSYFHNYRFLN